MSEFKYSFLKGNYFYDSFLRVCIWPPLPWNLCATPCNFSNTEVACNQPSLLGAFNHIQGPLQRGKPFHRTLHATPMEAHFQRGLNATCLTQGLHIAPTIVAWMMSCSERAAYNPMQVPSTGGSMQAPLLCRSEHFMQLLAKKKFEYNLSTSHPTPCGGSWQTWLFVYIRTCHDISSKKCLGLDPTHPSPPNQ